MLQEVSFSSCPMSLVVWVVTSETPLVPASLVLLALSLEIISDPALQSWVSFGFLSLVVNTNASSWESSSIMLRKRRQPRWPALSFVLGVWCDVNPVLGDWSWGHSLKSCRLVQCVPMRAFLAPGQACAFCCGMSNILGSCHQGLIAAVTHSQNTDN